MIPSDKHTLPEKTAQRYVFFASELLQHQRPASRSLHSGQGCALAGFLDVLESGEDICEPLWRVCSVMCICS